jgi:hypothetical protein
MKNRCYYVFLLVIVILLCGCVQKPSQNFGYFIIDGTIKTYQDTENGLLLGIEYVESKDQNTSGLYADLYANGKAWPPDEILYFLVKTDVNVNPLWLQQRMELKEVDLQIHIMSESKENGVYIINHLSSAGSNETDAMRELYNLLARSNCTRIEHKNEETVESILVFSDGEAVNSAFYNAGLREAQSVPIDEAWQYRITFYRNYVNETHKGDEETVCLINCNGIQIGDSMYDVKLPGGMDAFYAYWEGIYADYYALYGKS